MIKIIIHIDARNNKMIINSDTGLETILIDSTDFKDALLASLYTQVEFLKNQLEEKDLLIRTLIMKENDIYNKDTGLSSEGSEVNNCEDSLNNSEIREDSEISYLEEILEESILVNSEEIVDCLTFWRILKPLFTDKILANDNIVLVENRR